MKVSRSLEPWFEGTEHSHHFQCGELLFSHVASNPDNYRGLTKNRRGLYLSGTLYVVCFQSKYNSNEQYSCSSRRRLRATKNASIFHRSCNFGRRPLRSKSRDFNGIRPFQTRLRLQWLCLPERSSRTVLRRV